MTGFPEFPHGFLWGASTASYQIEGAPSEDGKGVSIWDTFTHQEGRIADGATGDVACDHYHRWQEDVALLAASSLNAYRFSIAWTRVQPDGRGAVNPKGLDFYERLVDALLEIGVVPTPTLFHWDLPQALEDDGGWLNRDTAQRFADYAGIVAERLADRVPRWITLNEPFVHLVYGYAMGVHAPGRTLMFDALPVAHHQLLGHGLGVAALRAHGVREVMIANNCTPVTPASDSEADRQAAEVYDSLHNRIFNDPILLGRYPDFSLFGVTPDFIREGDLAIVSTPIDALGINYYTPTRIAAAAPDAGMPFDLAKIEGVPVTGFGWPVYPPGLTDLLTGFRDRYGDALPPIYITESGCSYPDEQDAAGAIGDQRRIDYLDGHIRALHRAVEAGVDVRGYFIWSLIDNFEWAEGYRQRFGLVHVDFETGARTPKSSYEWLRDQLAPSLSV